MRDHHRIILQNILAVFASTTVSRAVKLMLIIAATRIFGAEDYGRFAYVLASASLAVIFIDLGVTRFIVQQLARDQRKSAIYLGHSLMINIVSGTFLVGLLCTYFSMFDSRPDMRYIALMLGLSVLCDCFTTSFKTIFQSQQKLVRQAWIIALTNIITSLLGFLVLFVWPNVLFFSISILLASLARLIVSRQLVTSFFQIRPVFVPSKQTVIYLLKGGWPFLLTSAFVYIYYQIDTLFLEHYWHSAIVGYYSAAYQLVGILLSISTIITTALYPAVSKLFSFDQNLMKDTIAKTFKITMILSLPVTITVVALANQIVTFIYGLDFAPSTTALRILILGVAIIFPSSVLGTSLRAIGLQVQILWITGFGALLNIILNYLFIPHYGLTAAAWTTLGTEAWVISAYFFLIVRQYGNFLLNKNSVLVIAVNLPLVALFYMTSGVSMWIMAPIAIILYIIAIEATGLLHLTDLKKLKN